jgi:hypothetical protein
MKPLLVGLFLASLPVAAWAWRGEKTHHQKARTTEVLHSATSSNSARSEQIPVEIVAKGSAPQWVYVEVQGQSVPEPGSFSLLVLTSLLLLRRQRENGK